MKFIKICPEVIKESWHRFSNERSDDLAAIISFYVLLAAIPSTGLIGFFISKIMGSDAELFHSIYVLSNGYFTSLDPNFFIKIKYLVKSIEKLGWLGILFSVPLGIVVFTKITSATNTIFGIPLKRSFFKNTLFQLVLMFFTGTLIFISLLLSLTFSTLHGYVSRSRFISQYISPTTITIIINFLITFLLPVLLSFSFFFIIYKLLPPVSVKTSASLISAIFTTTLWEIAKRIFTWYIGNVAIWGRLHGTLSAIVGFILLVNLSIYFLLFGASLTAVLNTEIREHET